MIERGLVLWSNPGDRVLTPFMGVGSEVYSAVRNGRLGIGVELKTSYYNQALKNLASAELVTESDQVSLDLEDEESEAFDVEVTDEAVAAEA